LDDSIPGYSTFNKPEDDTSTGDQTYPDESIHRIDGPRDIPKEPSQIGVIDQSNSKPSFFGLGKPHESPKTKYPYRDGRPNTHNAAISQRVVRRFLGTTDNVRRLESLPINPAELGLIIDHTDTWKPDQAKITRLRAKPYGAKTAATVVELWKLAQTQDQLIPAGAKIAATVSTMLSGLNPATVLKSSTCTATLKRADIKNLRWIFSVDCGNGAKVVRFKADRKGNVTKFMKMDFHVACSCPAWRWQGPEYHSTTKDFQDPRTPLQGTASTPDIRDPNRVNKVCKHVAAALSFTKGWTVPKPKKK